MQQASFTNKKSSCSNNLDQEQVGVLTVDSLYAGLFPAGAESPKANAKKWGSAPRFSNNAFMSYVSF